jgi:ABC-type branched-subunit amino acid transport system substrate-binding protein
MKLSSRLLGIACCWLCVACSSATKEEPPAAAPETEPAPPAAQAGLKVDRGIDLATKTIRLGVLNDESGPAAAIGKPYAIGKRILAAQINAQRSGLLPEGWRIELVERDHGYDPQASVQAYRETSDNVLLFAHSFGTPNTLPLRPMLTRDQMIALPASLASQMAQHRSTLLVAPSYEIEAMRAIDFAVEAAQAGKKRVAVKPAIVYQRDDYGQDGLRGWKRGTEQHGLAIAAERPVTAGQRDYEPIVTALKQAGATHVMLAVLPGATAGLLETAARLRYRPTWLGQSPSFIDAFFDAKLIKPALFANFYWVSGQPYWGEPLPGMEKFMHAYEAHGRSQSPPDYYVLSSYVQGLLAVEIARRAIEAGDATREGLFAVLPQMKAFDAGGLSQPIDLSVFPYQTSQRTRLLRPDFAKGGWTVASDYALPRALAHQ